MDLFPVRAIASTHSILEPNTVAQQINYCQFRDIFIGNVCLSPDSKPGFISLALGPDVGVGSNWSKSPTKELKGIRALSLEETPAEACGQSTAAPHTQGSGLGSEKYSC